QFPGIRGCTIGNPTSKPSSGDTTSPPRKAKRQPWSAPTNTRQPARMPLMPAMRPAANISSIADAPIRAPPINAATGVNSVMTDLQVLRHPRRSAQGLLSRFGTVGLNDQERLKLSRKCLPDCENRRLAKGVDRLKPA